MSGTTQRFLTPGTFLLVTAGIALILSACTPLGGGAAEAHGEAPEPRRPREEIVIGDSQFIAEEERGYDFIIPQALAVDEPPPATNTMAELEIALGITDLRLITSKTEMMTPEHRREESMFLMPDQSVLIIWWQETDPAWDALSNEVYLEGWPTGVRATLNEQRGHIQVLYADGDILGSVVIEKNFNNAYARPSLSAQETIDLALAAYTSLTQGK